jgi:hypothetical protein
MFSFRPTIAVTALGLALGAGQGACSDDDDNTTDTATDTTDTVDATDTNTADSNDASDTTAGDTDTVVAATPCSRAGGAAAVYGAVYNKANPVDANTLVGAFAADCKINAFFTSLTPTALNHVGECLATQVQELFGCEGITYAGSKDSAGVACRDMKTTHAGLNISKGDFDALIGDVVTFVTPLKDAGVLTEAEFNAAAGVLLGLQSDIVEKPEVTTPTKKSCNACDRAGGAAGVRGAVYNPANPVDSGTLVGTFAADCKINAFFTGLTPTALNHVGECLATQVAELFGCEGVTYAGSKDSAGVACRDMKTTHTGLNISKGDFDALIADVVAFVTPLRTAGILSDAEFNAAAGVLLGLQGDIVEQANVTMPTKEVCE